MACGCKKNQADGCGTCQYGSTAGATNWIDCAFWTERPGTPLRIKGQSVRYQNDAVRTKEGSICDNFVKASV